MPLKNLYGLHCSPFGYTFALYLDVYTLVISRFGPDVLLCHLQCADVSTLAFNAGGECVRIQRVYISARFLAVSRCSVETP